MNFEQQQARKLDHTLALIWPNCIIKALKPVQKYILRSFEITTTF